jgi:RNA 2',3'-cyclic 3'-phosphodiesterase
MIDVPVRLFIAVPISEPFREHLIKECIMLRKKLSFQKWTDPADFHITLKFLGDTTMEQIQQIHKYLIDLASETSPFELCHLGWGVFGPQAAPSILWAGLGGEVNSLHILQQKVDESLINIGFIQETRGFHPHITIARRYKAEFPLDTPLTQYLPKPAKSPIHWQVNEIKLYQSHLQKKPMYEEIASFNLGN